MAQRKEVMCEAHRLWRAYKAGQVTATSDRFSFFPQVRTCATALARLS